MGGADLHVHSTASDGRHAPDDVARRARVAGLAAIALTDHDTTDGVAVAERAGEAVGLRVVAGCEFSAAAPWGELHLLAYFLPAGNAVLDDFLGRQRAHRLERMVVIVERLAALGLAVTMADVRVAAGEGALGRPHAARALVAAGAAHSVQDAFQRYLGRGCAAFVPKTLPTVADVAALVRAVHGVSMAAHLGAAGTARHVRWLSDQGVTGLETVHPAHDAGARRRLHALAERFGMPVSGGSDWHGDGEPDGRRASLGGLNVPLAWLTRLEEHCNGRP